MGSSNKIDISRFDPTNASDDQIRLWLFAIIQAELEKDDAEIDEELIDECSDCEAFLSHSNPEITQEEYATGLARIKERAQAIQADGSNVTVQAKPKKRHFMRVAVYSLAATLAVAILSVSVVAAFNGSAAWESIVENIGWIWNADPGDTLNQEKIVLTKGETIEEFDSVEEALRINGFDGVLFPTAFPDGVSIEKIVYSHDGDETKYRLTFVFNSKDFSYRIFSYSNYQMENWEFAETLTINNRKFYIVFFPESGNYQASYYDNGFEQILLCPNYDDLLIILNNMKELEK